MREEERALFVVVTMEVLAEIMLVEGARGAGGHNNFDLVGMLVAERRKRRMMMMAARWMIRPSRH